MKTSRRLIEACAVAAGLASLVAVPAGQQRAGWGGRGQPLSEITNTPTPPYDWKGGPPPDQAEFAPALHCVHISTDGLVYVCERGMNRIQVFTKQGKYVREFHGRAQHAVARRHLQPRKVRNVRFDL